jgi:hypothetical protein
VTGAAVPQWAERPRFLDASAPLVVVRLFEGDALGDALE